MGQATQAVQSSDPKAIHKAVGQGMFAANLSMGAFVAAETQQDFDDALQQLIGTVTMMQSMAAGGPGGPGPSGFGPSPGGPGGFGKGGAGNTSAGPGPGPGGNSGAGPGVPLPGLMNSAGPGIPK